ncbi:MAG TPA: DUF6190 family protein [Dongiaceae bacterium]|nr:DUF6190 family protein [Dongiaceae bacterium]
MNCNDTRPDFVDATFFLGMHDNDPDRRMQSLDLFSRMQMRSLHMSLEQVGLCDDVIWHRSRQEQDAYYPFMDNLHTLMRIERIGYTRGDLSLALKDPRVRHLPPSQACTIAQVINCNGKLHTHDPQLLQDSSFHPWLAPVSLQPPLPFPAPLDGLYQDSLCLTLALQESRYV